VIERGSKHLSLRPGLTYPASIVTGAALSRTPVAIAGGRHAMGGQQFVAGGLFVDTRSLNRIVCFD
jgi:hypothetical protein